MSMARKLFRPMAGQTHARFAAFRMNGTLSYRGDTVFIDTTAPASQGSSGVLEGKTLGANDFIYCQILQVATGATINQALQCGVVEGTKIGDRNTTTAIADDGVVIVQVAGVHEQVWMTATTGVAGWLALAMSNSTLGAALPLVGVGVTTDAAIFGTSILGNILNTAATTGTRAAVTTTNYNAVWIRCGHVV